MATVQTVKRAASEANVPHRFLAIPGLNVYPVRDKNLSDLDEMCARTTEIVRRRIVAPVIRKTPIPDRTLIPGVISDTLTSLMVVDFRVHRGDIAT
jgi:hypothetical protein